MNYMISQEFHEKSKVYTSPDILKLLKLHVLFDADFDFLQYLSSDIAELQKRQTIFKDLIRHPSLAEQLGRLFDLLQTVDAMNFKADEKPTDLFKCMTIFSDFPKVFASVAQEIQQAGHSLPKRLFFKAGTADWRGDGTPGAFRRYGTGCGTFGFSQKHNL